MKKSSFILALLCCLVGATAFSATLNVNQDGSGDFTTIQAAIDAAAEGDVIVIHEGTYNENPNIGHLNMPPLKQDNLTLMAAEGANVEIVLTNDNNRMGSLAGLGADFGTNDLMGFLINGDNVVLDGLKIIQNASDVNNFNINVSLTVISSNVTIRNCEMVGPSAETAGDFVGMAITPLDAVSISQGVEALAFDLLVENCTFSQWPYAFASANFLLELGMPVPSPTSTLVDCEFFDNGNGIEIDDGDVTAESCYFHDNLGDGVSIGDDSITLLSCHISSNAGHGVSIEDSELEDDDEQGLPNVIIDDCYIADNGTEVGHHGIDMECGNLVVTNSIIANNVGSNMFFATEDNRDSTALFDHCDLYQTFVGVGVATTDTPEGIITCTIKNTNIVDYDGIVNDAGALSEIIVSYSNVFADNLQFDGEAEFIETDNVLNVDPLYVDPDNGDFQLQESSPVATAGEGGTYIGSQGVVGTEVIDWILR